MGYFFRSGFFLIRFQNGGQRFVGGGRFSSPAICGAVTVQIHRLGDVLMAMLSRDSTSLIHLAAFNIDL